MIVRPDGSVAQRLKRHVPGILYHDFPDPKLKGWLHNHKRMVLAEKEVYHNDRSSRHPRALNRQAMPSAVVVRQAGHCEQRGKTATGGDQ